MRNFLTVSLFALVVGMGTTSCATLESWFVEDPVRSQLMINSRMVSNLLL
jgi:hypothetical protein